MTESVESLILEHLRAIRADIGTLKDDNVFIKARMSSIEHQMAGVHADFATINSRMDGIEKRLDRIEKRLELSNA
jgi:predicted  nucleic acid-binding Zn-ribbon protein